MRLKAYLKLNKITNKQFSKELGISPVSLSRYISGERIPEKDIVLKILKQTDGSVSPNDFYYLKKNLYINNNYDIFTVFKLFHYCIYDIWS